MSFKNTLNKDQKYQALQEPLNLIFDPLIFW
jgi:hypothetical protein